ncbi:B12-binding domain-containing radical SAM protein [Tenacibaculum retecalamus]|uniref:B12-binding domain-containing radical SAM protein n=1 Tax=Tenacibaculum retecalamus TaxID=3018315 RepID=UPI0023D93F66|nr:radical SAM protein [Tenacibaculum retecalamus]WBX71659.1 radical SAM protein [Tenacibaculum retecalamus]
MAKLLFLQNMDYEFVGSMYISSMVKKHGHECDLEIGHQLKDFEEVIQKFNPDIIAFSIMSGSHNWGRKIAKEVKKKYNITTLFGGAHPTFFPEFIKEEGVDYLIRGEGEESVLDILDAIDKNKCFKNTPNLSYIDNEGKTKHNSLRNLRKDMDEYPYPDRKLYHTLDKTQHRQVRNIITSRGCPFHCSFCFEDAMRALYKGKGKYVRIRDIDKVIEECLQLKRDTPVEVIYFADDVFGMNRSWLYEFLERYKKEVNLPFICLVRADLVAADRDYAFNLAKGGCQSVFFGVESGNEDLRNQVLKKKLDDNEIIKAAELLHEAGITFRTYNILGLPDETLEDAYSTVELNIKIKADYPWCSIFSPFPGTELADYSLQKGYLSPTFSVEELDKSFFLSSQLELPHKRELQNLQKFFQTAVLWPWTFPFIKRIIKLPPNFLFRAWFGIIYFLVYIRSEKRNFWETFKFAIKNYKHVLVKE